MIKKIILTTLFGAGCAFVGAVAFAALEREVGHDILDAIAEGKVKASDLSRTQAACVILSMKDEDWNAINKRED